MLFCEVLYLDKFKCADFKYGNILFKFHCKNTKTFWSFSPKILQTGIFGHKFEQFCFFVKFCKYTNLRVLISNMTVVFKKFYNKSIQIIHFLSQIRSLLFLCKILELDKFQGADFKYDNIVLNVKAEDTAKKRILIPNFGLFVSWQSFANRQIWGRWFQIWQ